MMLAKDLSCVVCVNFMIQGPCMGSHGVVFLVGCTRGQCGGLRKGHRKSLNRLLEIDEARCQRNQTNLPKKKKHGGEVARGWVALKIASRTV